MTLAPSPPFRRLTYIKVQWRSPVAWRALLLSSEDHLRGLRETNEANHEGERGRCADPNQWHKCVMFKKLNNASDILPPLLDVIVFDIWVLYETGWKFLSVVSPFFQTKLNWLPSVLAALYNIRQLMKLLENLDFLVIWNQCSGGILFQWETADGAFEICTEVEMRGGLEWSGEQIDSQFKLWKANGWNGRDTRSCVYQEWRQPSSSSTPAPVGPKWLLRGEGLINLCHLSVKNRVASFLPVGSSFQTFVEVDKRGFQTICPKDYSQKLWNAEESFVVICFGVWWMWGCDGEEKEVFKLELYQRKHRQENQQTCVLVN